MLKKIIFFFFRKKVEGITAEMSPISKTKIFMVIEALLRGVEMVSPYFGHPITVPEDLHKLLYTLAGISYAERAIKL